MQKIIAYTFILICSIGIVSASETLCTFFVDTIDIEAKTVPHTVPVRNEQIQITTGNETVFIEITQRVVTQVICTEQQEYTYYIYVDSVDILSEVFFSETPMSTYHQLRSQGSVQVEAQTIRATVTYRVTSALTWALRLFEK